MHNYQRFQKDILQFGKNSSYRTGTGTRRVLKRTLNFDLREGFPAVTTKRLAQKAVFGELLSFMNAGTSIGELKHYTFGNAESDKRTIWCANYEKQGKELGYTKGYCGPVYGFNWRNFGGLRGPGVDQLQNLVNGINSDPTSRRHVVYTVDPATVHLAILPPCHDMFQCFVEDGYLDLEFHMR